VRAEPAGRGRCAWSAGVRSDIVAAVSQLPAAGDPLARDRWVRVVTSVVGVLSGAMALVTLALRELGDFDLPWHLALGRVFVAERGIPDVDPLAYGAGPILAAEPISDVVLYLAVRAGGPFALQLLGALAVAATAAFAMARARSASPAWAGWPALTVAMAAASPWLVVRPAVLSVALLSALLLLLDLHRRTGTRRWLLAASPLVLAWANVHGFVVIGVVALVLYAGYAGLCRIAGERWPALLPRAQGNDAAFTAAACAAAVLASFLNRAGPRLLLGPARAAADVGHIAEWMPPNARFLSQDEPAALALGVALALALLFGREPEASVGKAGARLPPLFDIGLAVLALGLAASAVRLIAPAAVMVAPIVARRTAGWWLALVERAPRLRVVVAGFAAATTLGFAGYAAAHGGTELGVGFYARNYPERAVRWVEHAAPAGRMWNFLPYGGWLAWRLHPRYQVLVDGRTGWQHDPALVARVRQSEIDAGAFDALADELGVQWAVSRATEGEANGLGVAGSRAFAMVHLDDITAVYVRRDGPNAALADGGYRVLRHLTDPGQWFQAARSGQRAEDLAHDGALALEQDPTSPRAAFFAACGAFAVRDRQRFDASLAALEALAPGHPALGLLRGSWWR
jgi:hypothetical protein